MKRTRTIRHLSVLIVIAVLLTAQPHQTSAQAEEKTVKLLTIGNSFAENALTFLPPLAESAGHKLVVGRANLGGCTLERHWNHVAQHEADPNSEGGSPYGRGKSSLKDLLTKEQWDYVTIQQVSYKSHDPETYQPFADNLYRYIKKHAPDATVLIHQIWAYRIDDPRFTPANKGKEPHTHTVMYQQVRQAYHALADKLNLRILPSGDAMYLADRDSNWGYRIDSAFDFDNATYPSLPDQTHSLHAGWSWRKNADGTRALRIDGHHASSAGKYLIGCVWFETLFNDDVTENEFIPKSIDPHYAKFLQQTAHTAVSALSK